MHLGPGRIEPVVGRIAPNGGHPGGSRLGEHRFPPAQAGMDRRHRLEPVVPPGGLVQPWIARGRVAPEDARQVSDPGLIDGDPVHRAKQRIG